MRYLDLYKPGDLVLVSVDSNTACNFVGRDSGIRIEVPIIGRETHYLLLGFTTKINSRVWEILPGDLDNLSVTDRVPNIYSYSYGWWCDEGENHIAGKVSPRTISGGIDCKQCQQYYPYAVPNQSDGTLICYGCKLFLA